MRSMTYGFRHAEHDLRMSMHRFEDVISAHAHPGNALNTPNTEQALREIGACAELVRRENHGPHQ
jgi:hypothetical protein